MVSSVAVDRAGLIYAFQRGAKADPVLVFDPSGTAYVGTVNDSVYRSTNGGDSWQRRNTGMNADTITGLAMLPGTQRVYAVSPGDADDGRNAGVYVSDNRGDQWTRVVDGLAPEAAQCVAVQASSGFTFVGTLGGGVFRR